MDKAAKKIETLTRHHTEVKVSRVWKRSRGRGDEWGEAEASAAVGSTTAYRVVTKNIAKNGQKMNLLYE